MKCAFSGCSKDCLELSNYCQEHQKVRVGKPLHKVAFKLTPAKAGKVIGRSAIGKTVGQKKVPVTVTVKKKT